MDATAAAVAVVRRRGRKVVVVVCGCGCDRRVEVAIFKGFVQTVASVEDGRLLLSARLLDQDGAELIAALPQHLVGVLERDERLLEVVLAEEKQLC